MASMPVMVAVDCAVAMLANAPVFAVMEGKMVAFGVDAPSHDAHGCVHRAHDHLAAAFRYALGRLAHVVNREHHTAGLRPRGLVALADPEGLAGRHFVLGSLPFAAVFSHVRGLETEGALIEFARPSHVFDHVVDRVNAAGSQNLLCCRHAPQDNRAYMTDTVRYSEDRKSVV